MVRLVLQGARNSATLRRPGDLAGTFQRLPVLRCTTCWISPSPVSGRQSSAGFVALVGPSSGRGALQLRQEAAAHAGGAGRHELSLQAESTCRWSSSGESWTKRHWNSASVNVLCFPMWSEPSQPCLAREFGTHA